MLSTLTGFIQSRAIIILLTTIALAGAALSYTRWQNERLRDSQVVLESNIRALQDQLAKAEQAIAAVEATGERRQDDQDALRAITRAVREEDVTAQCVNSPAVQRVLVQLRERRSNPVTAEDRDPSDDDDVP